MLMSVVGYPCHSQKSIVEFLGEANCSVYPDTSHRRVLVTGLDMMLLARLQGVKNKHWMVLDNLSHLRQLRVPLVGVIETSPSKFVRIPLSEPQFEKVELKQGVAFDILVMHARRMKKKVEAAQKVKAKIIKKGRS